MKDKNNNNKSEILQEFFLNALTLAVLNQSWLEVVSDEKMKDPELGYKDKEFSDLLARSIENASHSITLCEECGFFSSQENTPYAANSCSYCLSKLPSALATAAYFQTRQLKELFLTEQKEESWACSQE